MRKGFLAGLLVLVFHLGAAYGADDVQKGLASPAKGGTVVTTEKLTIADVKGHLARGDWLTLEEVYGIHQEGNTATVYYKGKEPVPPFIAAEGFQVTEATLELVRFNSGKWFVKDGATFLKR
ncbi:MAG: hypothetical protein SWH78_05640 [Thermodesulfobacteriota bacterium]|nr:hypothetical protein [Thermodesulfobacteriota bacterium]